MAKGMMTSTRQRVESHAGFSATPVRLTRARAKALMENPNKLKTGGFRDRTLKTHSQIPNSKFLKGSGHKNLQEHIYCSLL